MKLTTLDLFSILALIEENNQYNDDEDRLFWDDIAGRIRASLEV